MILNVINYFQPCLFWCYSHIVTCYIYQTLFFFCCCFFIDKVLSVLNSGMLYMCMSKTSCLQELLRWTFLMSMYSSFSYFVAQWVARVTRNVEVMFEPHQKAPIVSLSKKLPLLLCTGWFQERIRAWFHNQTKINWGPYGR